MTAADVVAILKPQGVISLISKADLPERLEDLDTEDLPAIALNNLELQPGREYLPVFYGTNLEKYVSQSFAIFLKGFLLIPFAPTLFGCAPGTWLIQHLKGEAFAKGNHLLN